MEDKQGGKPCLLRSIKEEQAGPTSLNRANSWLRESHIATSGSSHGGSLVVRLANIRSVKVTNKVARLQQVGRCSRLQDAFLFYWLGL